MVTVPQVRGARAMLKLTVAEGARMAGLAPNTIVRVESDKSVNTATLQVIRHALEEAGVQFIPANDGGPGVRLKAKGKA